MSPREHKADDDLDVQSLYIIRHGDRWDYENPEVRVWMRRSRSCPIKSYRVSQWNETTTRPGDPPLSTLGHQQAREVGQFLNPHLKDLDEVTWLSSPFLRCLQTSNEALSQIDNQNIPIRPEYSIFEWDGHGGAWHQSLPSLAERKHYFPRLDVSHASLFHPTLPEPRSQFLGRCQRTIQELQKRYPYRPRSALVLVTHAAACIGLSQVASGLLLHELTPAAPCSIYQLTRRSNDTSHWEMDVHDAPGSMNGHTNHLTMPLGKTVPWNNFGDKSVHRGYTGPPTSRFAPKEVSLREEEGNEL